MQSVLARPGIFPQDKKDADETKRFVRVFSVLSYQALACFVFAVVTEMPLGT